MVLWMLGYPEQARRRGDESLQVARVLGHPVNIINAFITTGWLHGQRGEENITLERAEMAVVLAREQGLPMYVAWGTINQGMARLLQGQWEASIALLREGLAAFVGNFGKASYLAWLASGYNGAGLVKEGFATVAEALQMMDQNDERISEAELYRIKGELILQSQTSLGHVKTSQDKSEDTAPRLLIPDPQDNAEACFQKAIAIAQKQQAKSLELRAVMSLVRLRQHQVQDHATRSTQHGSSTTQHDSHARLAEARRMLSEVYHWFTEGFDTKDLQEAKTVLAELRD
jgi:tetratricopeptide (TPR) repeat protein